MGAAVAGCRPPSSAIFLPGDRFHGLVSSSKGHRLFAKQGTPARSEQRDIEMERGDEAPGIGGP